MKTAQEIKKELAKIKQERAKIKKRLKVSRELKKLDISTNIKNYIFIKIHS